MNSDSDSDWDSMSEAPPITCNKAIDNNTKYPPPLTNNPEARNKMKSQKSHPQQTHAERTNIITSEAMVNHNSRYYQRNVGQTA